MGLRGKILFGFLILAIMLFAAGAWSVYEVRTVGTSVQRILDDNYKSINAAKTMIEGLERVDSGVLLLLSGKWKEGRSIVQQADVMFQEGFKTAGKNVTIPGEQDLVEKLATSYGSYKALWEKPIVGTQHEKDVDWYFKELHAAFLDVKTSVEDLMTMNDEVMYKTASDLKARAHRAIMPGIIAMLSAFVFALIFNYFVDYYMVSPIIRLTSAIRAFIETNTPVDVKIETKDELGNLVGSIHELLAEIRRTRAEK
jgi:HAMP domain-containing protein